MQFYQSYLTFLLLLSAIFLGLQEPLCQERRSQYEKYKVSPKARQLFFQLDSLISNPGNVNEVEKLLGQLEDQEGKDEFLAAELSYYYGRWHQQKGQIKKAIEAQDQALVFYNKLKKKPKENIAYVYNQQGINYYYLGDFDQSLVNFKAYLELVKQLYGEEGEKVGSAYNNLGLVYITLSDFDKALEYYQNGIEILENVYGEDDIYLTGVYKNLGVVYDQKGDFEVSYNYFKKVLDIRKATYGEKHYKVALAYQTLGNNYIHRGKIKESFTYFEKGLNIAISVLGEDHLELTNFYNGIGHAYYLFGDFDKAIDNFSKGLEVVNRLEEQNHPYLGMVYTNLGSAYSSKGLYQKAIEYYHLAEEVNFSNYEPDHIKYGDLYASLGTTYLDKGDYFRAKEYALKSLAVYQENVNLDHPDVAANYTHLGIIFQKWGDHRKAIEYYTKAISLLKNQFGFEHPDLVPPLVNIASTYRLLGDYDNALAYFNEAKTIVEKVFGKSSPNITMVLIGLADLYADLGEFEKAVEQYHRANEIYEANYGAVYPERGSNLINLGLLYFGNQDWEKAKKNLQKGREILVQSFGPVHPEVARSERCLGLIFHLQGESESGEQLLDSALVHLGFGQRQFNQVNSYPELVFTLRDKANLLQDRFEQEEDLSLLKASLETYELGFEAIDELMANLSSSGKEYLRSQIKEVYDRAVEANIQYARVTGQKEKEDRAFQIAELSKAFLLFEAMQESKALEFANVPDSLVEKENEMRVDINYFETKKYERISQTGNELDSLATDYNNRIVEQKKEYDALKDYLEKNYPDYYQLKFVTPTISIERVQQELLREEEALVEYVVGAEKLFIFLITRHDYEIIEMALDFPLVSKVEKLINTIQSRKSTGIGDLITISNELYQKLIAPVDGLLPRKLIIVPDGVLGYLPFEVLLAEKPRPRDATRFQEHAYLVKDHELSYAYSATLLQEIQEKKHRQAAQKEFLAFAPFYEGDTTFISSSTRRGGLYQTGLPALKYSGEEVYAIQQIWKGDTYLGEKATEEVFLELADQYRIIHLATHSKANDKVGDYSFLAFSEIKDSVENEILFVRDLYNLQLPAELVVLSACETGIGELQQGEGIISMARAFTYAGAKSIVTSLWSVNDEKTKNLMVSFHQYLKQGWTKEKALQQAKIDFLEESAGVEGHPFYWAAFIAIGNMNPINSN